jgi:hypothetical protein
MIVGSRPCTSVYFQYIALGHPVAHALQICPLASCPKTSDAPVAGVGGRVTILNDEGAGLNPKVELIELNYSTTEEKSKPQLMIRQ